MPHETMTPYLTPERERIFWSYVRLGPINDCWIWLRFCDDNGYGRFQVDKKAESAHVVAWKLTHPGYESEQYKKTIDHKCENTQCVNPNHLQEKTHVENVMLGNGWGAVNVRKTHCTPMNHEYTPENTMIVNNGKSRRCRKCYEMRNRGRGRN